MLLDSNSGSGDDGGDGGSGSANTAIIVVVLVFIVLGLGGVHHRRHLRQRRKDATRQLRPDGLAVHEERHRSDTLRGGDGFAQQIGRHADANTASASGMLHNPLFSPSAFHEIASTVPLPAAEDEIIADNPAMPESTPQPAKFWQCSSCSVMTPPGGATCVDCKTPKRDSSLAHPGQVGIGAMAAERLAGLRQMQLRQVGLDGYMAPGGLTNVPAANGNTDYAEVIDFVPFDADGTTASLRERWDHTRSADTGGGGPRPAYENHAVTRAVEHASRTSRGYENGVVGNRTEGVLPLEGGGTGYDTVVPMIRVSLPTQYSDLCATTSDNGHAETVLATSGPANDDDAGHQNGVVGNRTEGVLPLEGGGTGYDTVVPIRVSLPTQYSDLCATQVPPVRTMSPACEAVSTLPSTGTAAGPPRGAGPVLHADRRSAPAIRPLLMDRQVSRAQSSSDTDASST